MNKPLLIAHRGDRRFFPENTFPAFQSALTKGADGFEFDVHLDGYGMPIVVHNYLFDPNHLYPTLAQVLQEFGSQTHLELEIKTFAEGGVEKIAEVVNRFRPLDLTITSSVLPLFPLITRYFPNDHRGMIFRRWLVEDWMPTDFKIEWILRHLELTGADTLNLDPDLYFPELVTTLHQQGLLAHAHLFDAKAESYQKLLDLEIDEATFDDSELLKIKSEM